MHCIEYPHYDSKIITRRKFPAALERQLVTAVGVTIATSIPITDACIYQINSSADIDTWDCNN